MSRVSRVSRVIQGGYPGGLAETDSRWPNEVLTHNGIYTISARAPVYVRAYHEGLIASSAATLARRRAGMPGETPVRVSSCILFFIQWNYTDRIWLTGWATSMTSRMDCSKRCLYTVDMYYIAWRKWRNLGDLDPLTLPRTLKMKRPASQLEWE